MNLLCAKFCKKTPVGRDKVAPRPPRLPRTIPLRKPACLLGFLALGGSGVSVFNTLRMPCIAAPPRRRRRARGKVWKVDTPLPPIPPDRRNRPFPTPSFTNHRSTQHGRIPNRHRRIA